MKFGIRAKLFLVSVGLIAASVVAADAYLTRALEADMIAETRDDLFARARLIARDAEAIGASVSDLAAWDAQADALGLRAGGRVTLIGRDGAVLGDSEVSTAELPRVENHAGRPEVMEALAHGAGSGTRWSATVHRRMLYVAVPFRHSEAWVGVARLAEPLTQVDEAIGRLRRLVTIATLVALGVAVLMSTLAAHWMSRSARDLTAAARRMESGDLDVRVRPGGGDEIAELGRALDALAASLQGALADLRAERDRMGSVLGAMREGVLLLDGAGRVALANHALREMLLLDADVVGKTPLEVARNADLKRLLDGAQTGARDVSGEIEIGEPRPRRLLVHAARMPDEPAGLLAVFVDVTDLRRLESLRRDFVANVSHELRTPVTAVRTATETLRGALQTHPAAAGEFVEIIERHAERLHRLVEDLLDLSRIESREIRLNLELVDLRAIADQTVSLFAARATDRKLRVAVDVSDGARTARADRRAVEQVLSNLVDNAVKYASEGAGVAVRAVPEGGVVRVSVADTGPGIEETHLARLFERFYRVDAGRSRNLGGTGLGLAIVKHLVEAMGGTVGVESALDRGSTFSFTLRSA